MTTQFSRMPEDNKTAIRIRPLDVFKNSKNDVVYISQRKQHVYKYFDTHLFEFRQDPDGFLITRHNADLLNVMTYGFKVHRYDKKNVCLDEGGVFRIFDNDWFANDILINPNGQYSWKIVFLPEAMKEYNYAKIEISVSKFDSNSFNVHKDGKYFQNKKKGWTTIRCVGGMVTVHKPTLAAASTFFEKLFQGRKMRQYILDVQLVDMIELVYCLPPFQRPISIGSTYGALYRISETLGCLKLANLCFSYIEHTMKYAPLSASYIARWGYVLPEEKEYFNCTMTVTKYDVKKKLRDEKHGRELANDMYFGRLKSTIGGNQNFVGHPRER